MREGRGTWGGERKEGRGREAINLPHDRLKNKTLAERLSTSACCVLL